MATRDELVSIAVDDQSVAGTLVVPGTLVPGVLFVHGWGGSQQQYTARARQVSALGCICLTFDLRGHAQTKSQYETVSREDNLRDVVAAYDLLARQRDVDTSSIAVVGSSYGGYLAAILTAMRPVKWLALRVPALYKDSEWELPKGQLRTQQGLHAYRRLPVRPEESRALQSCTAFAGDAMIVESEHDEVVPHQVIINYRQAFVTAHSLTYRLIEGADHGLSEQPWQDAYTSVLVSWLSEMVTRARAGEQLLPKDVHVATLPKAVAPSD